MSVDAELRLLNIDIPAQPEVLVRLSLLLAEEDVDLKAVSLLLESDMALASAVLRAVNSSMYGMSGRVQSVQQAITYLGTREVTAVTFEMGLRAVFAPAPELEPMWQRASLRGLLMGRMAQRLDIDAWVAHSAGLFEECGKAVLFRHARDRYRPMLKAGPLDLELCELEREAFGVSHDALGGALCETWGLANAAVVSVRSHVRVQAALKLPDNPATRDIAALSALAAALMNDVSTIPTVAELLAPQLAVAEGDLIDAARRVEELVDRQRDSTA
ncbi:MAG: histidine kinase [Rhizobacter sp.]|jgi:HD-like signal output (HDOD) protein|nr:histidine kinase [Rhizobacter sp.]